MLSLVVAGETIEPHCGLGNYLECLAAALKDTRPKEVGALIVRKTSVKRHSVLRQMLKSVLSMRACRSLSCFRRSLLATRWAAEWALLPADAVCLLPFIAFADDGELDRYYELLCNRPLVLVIHDLHPFYYPEHFTFCPSAPERLRTRLQLLIPRAQQIVTHNQFTKNDICNRFPAANGKCRVALLPALFDPGKLDAQGGRLDDMTQLGIRPPYALWASSGTLVHKNHDRLIASWRQLLNESYDIQLVCTGTKEPRWDEIRKSIVATGLQNRVLFTGVVTNRDLMADIVRGATLAVCPTLYEGGGSGPAAESVLAEVPVCCSRIPQTEEQFAGLDGVNWFDPYSVCDITRCVREVLDDYPKAKSRAVSAAREYRHLRSWPSVARVYWDAVLASMPT
ncbi:MAG: glycosyltransferase [Planctomycetota bacterium]